MTVTDAQRDTIRLRFTLNGREATVDTLPLRPLLELLREEFEELDPKAGCGVGRCGACAVLLDGAPANACLLRAYQIEGRSVATARAAPGADAVRVALSEAGALQCGYCANGFVTAIAWLSATRPDAAPEEIEQALAGHLCRCSGYAGLRRVIARLWETS